MPQPPCARRLLLGAALADGAPVGGDEVDRHADLLQQVGGDLAHRLERGLVLRHEAGHGLAACSRPRRAASWPPSMLRLPLSASPPGLGVERRAGREEARQRLPQLVVRADDGAHVVFLVQRHLHGLAHLHVVEGRMQVVEAEGADVAERIGDVDLDVAVALQHRHEIRERVSHQSISPFCSAADAVAGIRHDDPLDAVEVDRLAAGEPVGGLGPRHVVGELLEGGERARLPVAAHELHRAGADVLLDLLEGIGLGDALRHDEAAGRADLAEREKHFRIWLREHPLEGAVVDGGELLLDRLEHLAHGVARGPARDRGARSPWRAPARRRGT